MKKLLIIATVITLSSNSYALTPTEGRGYITPDVPEKNVAPNDQTSVNDQPSVGTVMHEHRFMHEHHPAALDSKFWKDMERNNNKNR